MGSDQIIQSIVRVLKIDGEFLHVADVSALQNLFPRNVRLKAVEGALFDCFVDFLSYRAVLLLQPINGLLQLLVVSPGLVQLSFLPQCRR